MVAIATVAMEDMEIAMVAMEDMEIAMVAMEDMEMVMEAAAIATVPTINTFLLFERIFYNFYILKNYFKNKSNGLLNTHRYPSLFFLGKICPFRDFY